MVLDHAGVKPNPARDRRVRLPREDEEEINPPTAEHVEAVYRLMPAKHRLALLWLDWSGARVSSVDLTLVGDYDGLGIPVSWNIAARYRSSRSNVIP
jgi:hypothetical protein